MPFSIPASELGEAPPLPGGARVCRAVHLLAAAIGFLIGGSNLVWWLAGGSPGHTAFVMRINTATAVTAAALSLALWFRSENSRLRGRIAQGFGALAAIIGGLTAAQDLFGVNLRIDELLAPGTLPGDAGGSFAVHPGRMSLNAALSLFFLGLSLAAMDTCVSFRKTRVCAAPPLAFLAALPAMLGLVGYLLAVGTFTGMLRSTTILLHTAVALLALAIGVLAARPDRPPVKRIISTGAEGLLLRWTLPGTLALLLMLGWLVGRGRQEGLVAPGEGAALMLYGGMVLLSGLLVAASRAVSRQETSARRADAALRAGRERSRAIVDTALDAVVLMNAPGNVIAWNPSAERIFGWRADEIIGRPLAEHIIPERLRTLHTRGLARYMETGEAPVFNRRLEMPAVRRDGREFPVELSINRLPGGADPALFVGFIRDISERKAAEKELRSAKEAAEAASHAKDNFIAALSHELRTPLAPVLMSAASMRDDEKLPLPVREAMSMIERNIALEARLIDDLLDLTAITRGKLPLRIEHCDAHSLVAHAVEIVREEAEAKQVAITLDLSAPQSGLRGDPARLQQVFWNVLKNAVKFTPPNGSITVHTHENSGSDRLITEITDTGVGFAAEVSERMFQPFEQAGREGDHRFGGLGLGLAIARTIVDLHGGKIRASSPGFGQGATFTIELPGPLPSPAGFTANADSEPTKEARPMRILLVEDHEPTLTVLKRLLERAGHQVVTAQSVAAGLAASAPDGHFDVVVSDLGLPDGTGFQLMGQLRERHPALPGIALSGYGTQEDLERSREVGFSAHLVKPVAFDQLSRALRNAGRGR